jgi:hypothetical protein
MTKSRYERVSIVTGLLSPSTRKRSFVGMSVRINIMFIKTGEEKIHKFVIDFFIVLTYNRPVPKPMKHDRKVL